MPQYFVFRITHQSQTLKREKGDEQAKNVAHDATINTYG